MHLACNQDDGWRSIEPGTIELMGAACATYRQSLGAFIQVSFPCDALELN